MRVLVCTTGYESEAIQARHGDFFALFKDLLFADGDEWRQWHCQRDPAPGLDDWDVIVITGSAADAHGDDPWIRNLEDFVRKAYARGIKILGVCFGHQLLARALGGDSNRNPAGWEVGRHEVTATSALLQKPWAQGIERFHLYDFHQDEVKCLPPGAELLASSDVTRNHMYGLGDQVLCTQGHPEFTAAQIKDLFDELERAGVIPQDVANHGRASLTADCETYRKLIRRFFRGA